MRSTWALIAVLILGGGGVVSWQRSEIVHLRDQVARQDVTLGDIQARMTEVSAVPPSRESWLRRADGYSSELRADERNLILSQYRDVMAKMDLPPATAARLQDLLTDRVEAVLDAEDASARAGFAQGSAAMSSAVASAIADRDREIVALLGPDGSRRLNGFVSGGSPESAGVPAPATPPIVVDVVMQTPVQPSYEDQSAPVDVADAYAAPYYYPYTYFYPFTSVVFGRSFGRPFVGGRTGPVRTERPVFNGSERPVFNGSENRLAMRPR